MVDLEGAIALEQEKSERASINSDEEEEDSMGAGARAGNEEDQMQYITSKRDEKMATRHLTDKLKRKSYYNEGGSVEGLDRGLAMTPPAIAVLAHMQYANRPDSPTRSHEDVSLLPLRARTMSVEDVTIIEEASKELDGVDTREILFENIPEPLPHSKTYAKVMIIEPEVTEDDFDDVDAWDSCKRLQKCLDLRKKWIGMHPEAPQDKRPPLRNEKGVEQGVVGTGVSTPAPVGTPRRTGMMNKAPRAHPDDYRRRPVPEYDIFKEVLPDFTQQSSTGGGDENGNARNEKGVQEYQFFMRRGVMICVPIDSQWSSYNKNDKDADRDNVDSEGVFSQDDESGSSSPPRPGSLRIPIPEPSTLERGVSAASPHSASIIQEIVKNTRSHAPRPDTLEPESAFPVPSFDEFLLDFRKLRTAVHSGPVTSYSYKRLELLAAKFNLHVLLNSTRELEAQKSVPHRDFYNIRKVDTHVHHSASMSQKHLLRFIKHKLRHNPNEVVIERDGRPMTLGEVFVSLQLTAYDLSIDTLDMHAHNTFHRFDRFNLKYNPAGQSRLREIFLKTDNHIHGRYLVSPFNPFRGYLQPQLGLM